MHKEITQGHQARLKIKAGIDKAANAVAPTLGAVGMEAMIEYKGLDPIHCDDGITILKQLEFKDPYENMGLQVLRKAALRTSTEGGDGTATTTVITRALVEEAFKEIANDSSKIREVRERLDRGLVEVLEELTKIKREVTEADVERIATIASLDQEVAKLIAEVIKEVGVNGVVTVEKSSKHGYSHEVVKGARFDKGLISPFFINDHENERAVLENAYIILADRKISSNEHFLNLLKTIGTGKDILFIATDVDSVALASLSMNAQNGIARIACVQNPYSSSRARDFLFDIAALTGATVISEEMGMKLDEADVKMCGRAEKVIATRHNTTIIGGQGSDVLQARIDSIKSQIEETTSEYQKMMLEERLAQLTGGIGVIRVGAYTDTEFHAKKLKFDNAINATQAALQEGILAGGGSALLDVSIKVSEPMFAHAIQAPFRQMARNAGLHDKPTLAVDRVGFEAIDFKTKVKADMFEAGIIDPFKVTRLALESAVAVTKSVVGMETAMVVAEEPDAKK